MAKAFGLKQVGYVDCAGGGQTVVRDRIAYIGRMRAPHGTTIVDVRDSKSPAGLTELPMLPGTDSHKVRVVGDMMVINQEINNSDSRPRTRTRCARSPIRSRMYPRGPTACRATTSRRTRAASSI